jgi:hypothetical protein
MSLPHIFTTLCLLGAGFFGLPRTLRSQDSAASTRDSARAGSDTTGRADTTQTAKSSDSAGKPAGADSTLGDSARGDTTRASADSAKAPARDTSHSSAAGASTRSDTGDVVRPDSILVAACQGSNASSVARDLLVIVFAPGTGAAERAAAVRTVKGELLGPVDVAQPDAYYLRVPSDGQEFQLRAAADQLAQSGQVKEVGSRACPGGSALPPEHR